ncbi:MAG TPA: response regulator [Verrucomicrobiae bacterium]|nr:response regulator [Verrucomicrobiae bacterium]
MPAAPSLHVVVVDDDVGLLRLVEKALRREGFNTTIFSSGEEAISWLGSNQPGLMLLDLKLKDIGGKELLARLADAGNPVPFVVITGQGDERVAVEMMKRGAIDYLVKDAQFIDLVPAVARRALDQSERDRQLLAAQAALKESREQLLTISEREQSRFGAELHDGLGQQLTAIELRCQSLKEDLPRNRPDLLAQISEISQFLREAISQTRSLARGLSPVNLGSGGLVEALGELASRMTVERRVKCLFESAVEATPADSGAHAHLFRIAQEAVNNAVKHSGGREVRVRLSNEGGALRLTVSDNGRGLPKESQAQEGIGLQIMRHRASVIGAELEVESRPGCGVTVTCVLKGRD